MHPRVSINALCFPGADWATMSEAWDRLAPHRISFPSALAPADPAAVRADLERRGRRVESITHPFLSGARLDAGAEVLADATQRLTDVVEWAGAVGAHSIYMVTGGRGTLAWESAAERFGDAVAPGIEAARRAGVMLLVEPVASLYADLHLATSFHDAATLARTAGLGICLDVFASWTEADLGGRIARHVDDIHLVQVGDYVLGDRQVPSRAVPGDGDIPLEAIFHDLHDAGYVGAFDLELLGPRIDAEGHLTAVGRAADRVSELIERTAV